VAVADRPKVVTPVASQVFPVPVRAQPEALGLL